MAELTFEGRTEVDWMTRRQKVFQTGEKQGQRASVGGREYSRWEGREAAKATTAVRVGGGTAGEGDGPCNLCLIIYF